jgi:glycogen(starch) synthase
MRIMLVSREYPPYTPSGGIGSYSACVASALAARGNAVHVLCCWPGQTAEDEFDKGAVIHRRPARRLPGLGRLLRMPGTAGRLQHAVSVAWQMRQLGILADIIEAPDYMAEGLFAHRGHRRQQTPPIVAHLHTPSVLLRRFNNRSPTWDNALSDRLERRAVEVADAVTAPSRLIVELLRADHGWRELEKARIVPNPIDVAHWHHVELPTLTERRVLFVGRIEPLKGADVLVDAIALLAREVDDLQAVFVGSSGFDREGRSHRETLARRARDTRARYRFLDPVPRADLARLYEGARVVAIPSLYDNFPMVALEAMASARPVVCTDYVGTAELVRYIEAGSVVPARDPVALAEALRPYLLDVRFATKVGKAARQAVVRFCSPETIASKRERLYRELAT